MAAKQGNISLTPMRPVDLGDRNRSMRVDFPRFVGDDPRGWLRRCHRYFMLNPMTEVEKVMLASMQLDSKAEYWYMDYVEGREFMGWNVFANMLLERFQEGEGENIIGDFNKLQQEGSVEEYRDKFEELKSFMTHFHRALPEEYYIKSFISGLKPDIRDMVMILKPLSLPQAINIAKLQESTLERQKVGSKGPLRAYSQNPQPLKAVRTTPLEPVRGLIEPRATITKRLSNEEVEERKKKGLCFNCDEKYVYGHKCKKVFCIEGVENPYPEITEIENEEEEEAQVSLHAMVGQVTPETIKVVGKVKNNSSSILIDTGSTHNFLDPHTAKKLGCEIVLTNNLLVTVADGAQVQCNSKCTQFQWEMGNNHFLFDMRILKLGGCELVLGVDFLKKFGLVLFDYKNLIITLRHGDREIQIQGLQHGSTSLSMITAKGLQKMLKKDEFRVGCFCMMIQGEQENAGQPESIKMQELLMEYQDLFKEPTGLPPLRGAEHQIQLKDGAIPFKMQPYRYPYMQRKEIEAMIEDMLRTGIIQPSSSPFASPILLVKKKDGS